MVNRTLEWHRIVNAKPSPDTIDRRTAAITDLVKAYDEATDWEVILQSVAGVVAGFEKNHSQDSSAVGLVFRSLQGKDSTVPQDLTDNALELRAAAATALGEIISRSPDKYPDSTALLVAITFQTGLGIRPRPKERHLKAMLDELDQASRSTLQRAQKMIRQRTPSGKKILSIDENAAADPAAAIKNLTKAAKEMASEFANQSSLDREELDILWWLFSGASTTSGLSVNDLAAGKAALVVGAEIANMCLLPPPNNANAFVRRGISLTKNPDAKRSLEKIIAETDSATWALFDAEADGSLGEDYPAICTLSWVCAKLKSSAVTTGWLPEFSAKTGLDASQSFDAFAVAEQAFKERIAQRLYSSMNGG